MVPTLEQIDQDVIDIFHGRQHKDPPGSMRKWREVALRVGEALASGDDGPLNYYAFTPEQWETWMQNTIKNVKGKR